MPIRLFGLKAEQHRELPQCPAGGLVALLALGSFSPPWVSVPEFVRNQTPPPFSLQQPSAHVG